MKHKHYDVIVAWAEDKTIQIEDCYAEWADWNHSFCPSFDEDDNYRIKPEPKPDIEYRVVIHMSLNGSEYAPYISQWSPGEAPNLKVVFDVETGKLKSAEVIK
jgi:hypothetical protein